MFFQTQQISADFNKGGRMNKEDNREPLLSRKEAAAYLNISITTIAVWDCTKRYNLEPIKIGNRVRYRRSSLDRFIEEQINSK